MRHTFYSLALAAVILTGQVVGADAAANAGSAKKTGASYGNTKGKGKSKKKSKGTKKSANPTGSTGSAPADQPAASADQKPNVQAEAGSSMFEKHKKSWAVGLHAGLPRLTGDIPTNLFSLGYGGYIQKALGHTFAIRTNVVSGWVSGINHKKNGLGSIDANNSVNGVLDKKVNYVASRSGIFSNYRTSFIKATLDGVVNINNLNFMSEAPRLGLYLTFGAGGMFYKPMVDQLDANGNMYNYDLVTAETKKEILNQLKSLRDNKFESQGDREPNADTYAGYLLAPAFSGGVGAQFKLNERLTLFTEASYTYTGNDLMDGQRWYGFGVPTIEPDAFLYFNLGVNVRLGRVENVYWFTNPLALPYKTIAENKQKLAKVDDLEKDVDELKKKQDSTATAVTALASDADGDGVSDHFDMEDNTPAGAITNGAGQTIFYRDEQGNMVFVDPNAPDEEEGMDPNSMATGDGDNSANGENGNGSGNKNSYNSGNGRGNSTGSGTGSRTKNGNGSGSNGNGSGNSGDNWGDGGNNGTFYDGSTQGGRSKNATATNAAGKKKTTFNPKKTAGRTVMLAADGNGGYKSSADPGVSTAIGFLPAVFFTSGSATLENKFYPQLYEVARALKANPNVKIRVIGFTDHRNTERFNKDLGMRRAKVVANALKSYFGVTESQIIIESKGEAEPLTNAKGVGALAANRRVQFEVAGKESSKPGPDGRTSGGKAVKSAPAPSEAPASENEFKSDDIVAPAPAPAPAVKKAAAPKKAAAKPAATKKAAPAKPAAKPAEAPAEQPATPAQPGWDEEAPAQQPAQPTQTDSMQSAPSTPAQPQNEEPKKPATEESDF